MMSVVVSRLQVTPKQTGIGSMHAVTLLVRGGKGGQSCTTCMETDPTHMSMPSHVGILLTFSPNTMV